VSKASEDLKKVKARGIELAESGISAETLQFVMECDIAILVLERLDAIESQLRVVNGLVGGGR
jgi:hypothetical protein